VPFTPFTNTYNPWSQGVMSQLGIQAWDYPSWFVSNNTTALGTAGVLYGVRIPLPGSIVTITNVNYVVGTAGATLTASENFIGVYDTNGNQIGITADQTTNFGTQGAHLGVPLVGGPFQTAAPFVFLFALFNGTTGPALTRASSGGTGSGMPAAGVLNATGSNLPFCTNSSGLTSMPATVTYSSNSGSTSSPSYFWAGLS
jgi:hypothetical protein